MPKHLTDGKITYIHGATPRRPDPLIEADMDRWRDIQKSRTTLSQLEAGENDPALGQPMPAAPSVRSYFLDTHDAEPVAEVFYGGPASGEMAVADVDEYKIWGTDPNRSARPPLRVNWPVLAIWLAILLMLTMIWLGLAGIVSSVRFTDFLQSIALGSK